MHRALRPFVLPAPPSSAEIVADKTDRRSAAAHPRAPATTDAAKFQPAAPGSHKSAPHLRVARKALAIKTSVSPQWHGEALRDSRYQVPSNSAPPSVPARLRGRQPSPTVALRSGRPPATSARAHPPELVSASPAPPDSHYQRR